MLRFRCTMCTNITKIKIKKMLKSNIRNSWNLKITDIFWLHLVQYDALWILEMCCRHIWHFPEEMFLVFLHDMCIFYIQSYWLLQFFTSPMLCVIILYMTGGAYSLKSIPECIFLRNFFMAILFTLRVLARNLLRGNRRRNTFRISFWCLAGTRILALRLISQHTTC